MTKYLHLIGLVFLAGFWSLHISFAKVINQSDIQMIMAVTLLYVGVMVIFLTSLFYIKNRRLPNLRAARLLLFFLVTGIGGYIFPVMSELFAAPNLPLALMMLLTTTTPLVTLMISWAWRLEKPSILRMLGVSFGIVSILILLDNPTVGFPESPLWVAVMMVAVFSYSFIDCFIERYWPEGFSINEVASADAIVAFCLMVVLSLSFGVETQHLSRVIDDHLWPVLGIVCSSMASVLLFFYLVRKEGAVYVSVASYIALFIGIVGGYLVFEEALSPYFYASVVLLLFGLGLIEYSKHIRNVSR